VGQSSGTDGYDVLGGGAVVEGILRPPHTHTGEKDTDRAQNKADADNTEQLLKESVFDLSEGPHEQVYPAIKHHQRNKSVYGQGHYRS
jgi:hypothetical protein